MSEIIVKMKSDYIKIKGGEYIRDLVRCKDCKYSSHNKVYGCRFEPFDTSENGGRMYSNDYCSFGERADT